MKKSTLQYVLFTCLLILSLSSYIFIKKVTVVQPTATETIEETADQDNDTVLPDVKIIKKVIQKGKDYIFMF